MFDWLRDPPETGEPLSLNTITARVAVSFVAGFVVAGVYAVGIGRRKNEPITLPTTLVLLTVVIALVTMVIGNSVARAFGLVGALSIVRFRTVVEDTRDTAFVIFAVVIGMAVGAGYAVLAAIGIPAVLLAAVLMRWGWPDANGQQPPATLSVKIALGHDPEVLIGSVLTQHVSESRLVGTATARQGALLELTYQVRLRSSASSFAFVADLNRIEGVQGVELRGG
jgi:hypothetical protein